MNIELLNQARALLENVTPLKTDCGALCNAACCKDESEAGGGVWLLPGEILNCNWGSIIDSSMPVTNTPVKMLICHSMCKRSERPFMCRLFPLTPYFNQKKQAWDVRIDRRAAMLCPLFNYGVKGLNPEFVAAARAAIKLLDEDTLTKLAAEEAAYRMSL